MRADAYVRSAHLSVDAAVRINFEASVFVIAGLLNANTRVVHINVRGEVIRGHGEILDIERAFLIDRNAEVLRVVVDECHIVNGSQRHSAD